MSYEKSADLVEIGKHIDALFEEFEKRTGRNLSLEVEPGTFLAANSASLITEVIDVVDTGNDGYTFIKVDAGMTEVTRPSLYGAQHPIVTISRNGTISSETLDYVVVGHNCESGDIFTPAP